MSGDLRDLLAQASSSFSTLRATVHQRTFNAAMDEAVRRLHPDQPVNTPPIPDSFPPPSGVIEFVDRVWTDGRGRWRIERSAAWPDGKDPAVTVIDGTRWWLYSLETGAISNIDEPDVGMGTRSVIEPLLDPSILIDNYDLDVIGPVTHAGRDGIALRATYRPDTEDRRFGSPDPFKFGDHRELIMDAERGIILRDAGVINGQRFWLTDIEEIGFDESFPNDTFVLTPPAGVEMRTTMYPKPRSVSIEEAAGLVPFKVFMPGFVPPGARTEVIYQAGQERPPWEPSVWIQYSGPDERSSIVVTEHATDTLWGTLRSTEDWEEVDGDPRFLFQERSLFQTARAVRVDRDGTTVFIHGGPDRSTAVDIDRKVLLDIARSLTRVSVPPPVAS